MNVRNALESAVDSPIQYLDTASVLKRIRKARKPLGIVPGDLPKKLVQQCADEIALPATLIFNSITSTTQYPLSW